MPPRYENYPRIAIVTGSDSGIGEACAVALAQDGYDVGSAPYCAAKGGLGMLTQVLALELAEHGITANSIAPGEIATPMTGQENEDPHQAERPGVPVGRPGDAREIAAVAAFLASPASAYVNGVSWAVDGGMLLMGPQAGSHLESNDWRRP